MSNYSPLSVNQDQRTLTTDYLLNKFFITCRQGEMDCIIEANLKLINLFFDDVKYQYRVINHTRELNHFELEFKDEHGWVKGED